MVTGQSASPGGRSKASPLAQTLVPSNGTYTIGISGFQRVERRTSRPTGWKNDGMVTGWVLAKPGRWHISTAVAPRGTGSPPLDSTALHAWNGYPQGPGGGTTLPWWPVPFGDHRRVARGCVSNVHRFRRDHHQSTPNRALIRMVVFWGRGLGN